MYNHDIECERRTPIQLFAKPQFNEQLYGYYYLELQKLYSYTRKALDEYNMIQDNDKIAIGVSGGKDSLTLLYALAGLRRFYPKKFDLIAISVDLGFGIQDFSEIEKLCNQ